MVDDQVMISPRPKLACPQPLGRDVRIDADTLKSLFHLRQVKAAEHLGICLTSLKSACRKLGITRWPYIKSVGLGQRMPDDQALVSDLDYNLMEFFGAPRSETSNEGSPGLFLSQPSKLQASPALSSSRPPVVEEAHEDDPILQELGISSLEEGWSGTNFFDAE
eukprot:229155-Hanusia_phi.AAC.1